MAFVLPPAIVAGEETDAYGIPDWWKIRYFGSTNGLGTAALEDWDHDGMNNRSEWVAGTNPTNAHSRLEISVWSVLPGLDWELCWSSVEGKRYSVDKSTNLLEGFTTTISSNIPATADFTLLTIPVHSIDREFFRVRVEE